MEPKMKPRLFIESSVISYYTARPSRDLIAAGHHGMDYLVSWNFTHIVGARPRGIIQRIDYRLHMETPVICTLEELFDESL
jgi:hypothetical protein